MYQHPFENVKHVVMVGVGGIGVSALAKYFLWRKIKVSGFDVQENEFTNELKKYGAKIKIGESKKQSLPKNIDLLIYSAAVPSADTLRQEAKIRGIKMLSYPEALGEISKMRDTIAVTGTKGKTTVTAFIGHILKTAGRDPLVIVGGKTNAFDQGNFQPGNGPFVVEACEYRAHMLHIHPYRVVLTNIEAEHLDFYKDQHDIERRMTEFARKLPRDGVCVFSHDDSGARIVGDQFAQHGTAISFGFHEQSRVSADERKILHNGYQSFRLFTHELTDDKKHLHHSSHGTITLSMPGLYSVENALAAIATALSLGISFHHIQKAFHTFPLSLWRRFEHVGTFHHAPVISDYAHHPMAVAGVLQAARETYPEKRIVAVFQPHLVARTRSLFAEFVQSFLYADDVIVMPTYRVAGRESKEAEDTSPQDLVAALFEQKCSAFFVDDTKALSAILKNMSANSIILFLGAGDIDELARKMTD